MTSRALMNADPAQHPTVACEVPSEQRLLGDLVSVPIWAVRNRSLIVGEIPGTLTTTLRRPSGRAASARGTSQSLTLFRRELRAELGARPIALSRQEFLVLEQLLVRPGVVFSADDLRVVISAGDRTVSRSRVREVVHHVRRAIGDSSRQHLTTIRGSGYMWRAWGNGEPAPRSR